MFNRVMPSAWATAPEVSSSTTTNRRARLSHAATAQAVKACSATCPSRSVPSRACAARIAPGAAAALIRGGSTMGLGSQPVKCGGWPLFGQIGGASEIIGNGPEKGGHSGLPRQLQARIAGMDLGHRRIILAPQTRA